MKRLSSGQTKVNVHAYMYTFPRSSLYHSSPPVTERDTFQALGLHPVRLPQENKDGGLWEISSLTCLPFW